jgi:hypothetical protein
MLWVTFGHAETTGMTVAVGANVKDENYFAEPKGLLRALVPAARIASGIGGKRGRAGEPTCASGYCLEPVKVPSPNCPSDTLPLIFLPSVLPEYFTARLWPCASTLYSIVTSSPLTVPVTCASPS